jgi:adenylate cyclase
LELEQRCADLESMLEVTSEHADFIEAELEKRNVLIQQIFGRYVTREVVEQLLSTPDGLKIGGERRDITVLSSDLRGFTALSERLSAEDVIRILNYYLGVMADVILSWGGSLNELLGDGILVLFGAPAPGPGHARRAVGCALAMQAAMARVNATLASWGYAALEMGIGINSGEVVVGNVGSEQRAKYTAVGRTVNLAYRIESYSVGGDVLVSEATLRAAGAGVVVLGSSQAWPKGSRGPITFYSIGGLDEEPAIALRSRGEDRLVRTGPVAVSIAEVNDKDVAPNPRPALLFEVGMREAVLRFVEAETPLPSLFANLRIELAGIGEAYAKVRSVAAAERSFTARLTHLSPEVERWVAALLAGREPAP